MNTDGSLEQRTDKTGIQQDPCREKAGDRDTISISSTQGQDSVVVGDLPVVYMNHDGTIERQTKETSL